MRGALADEDDVRRRPLVSKQQRAKPPLSGILLRPFDQHAVAARAADANVQVRIIAANSGPWKPREMERLAQRIPNFAGVPRPIDGQRDGLPHRLLVTDQQKSADRDQCDHN